MVNQRYSALPIVALLLKVLGFAVILIGLIVSVTYFISGKTDPFVQLSQLMDVRVELAARVTPGFWAGHVWPACKEFICSLSAGLLLIGISEGIHVVMDIEENTRKAADAATKTVSVPTPRV